ncbi:MAG: T9SS type A sorting domain-containing protein [Bacteroidetes bacterium]|nr:T9SS type A sorting domain-containing protein [Bacteroidota bacterium]
MAYPNPVQSELTIALPSTVTGTVSYRVFTVQGAEVSKGILSNGFAKLSVLKWEAGIYLLEITDDAGYKSYRQIIKQ